MELPGTLMGLSLASLEELYQDAPLGPWPVGLQRGRVLARVESPLARSVRGALLAAPFEGLPFGIDCGRRVWFFGLPRLRVGAFRPTRGRSRWRDAEVFRLDYGASRLPWPVRGWLYDELKPLTDTLCLGIGGINEGRGRGDLFFFALEPYEAVTGARAGRAPSPRPR